MGFVFLDSLFSCLPGTGEYYIVYVRVDLAGLMVEFYCGVCSGYCLDVSLTPLSSQFTVVLYTIHSSNHTIQYYYGVFLYFLL